MKWITKKFRSLSLSSQIFFLISSFIILLILIQYIISQAVFQDYYINTQLANIETEVDQYIEDLRVNPTDNYFSTMYQFSEQNSSISIILNRSENNSLAPIETDFSLYSLVVRDISTYETYKIVLPEPASTIRENNIVSALVQKRPGDNNEYNTYSLKVNNLEIYSQGVCDDCIEIYGKIIEIQSPKNLNIYFTNNQVAVSELSNLNSNEDLDFSKADEGLQFRDINDFTTNIVYLHHITGDTYVMTIYVLESQDTLQGIIDTYNLTIYAVMIALAFIISTIVSKMISTPIKEIDEVAKGISELDFEAQAKEFQNRETASLSSSINKISVNLKENIDKLNNRNEEMLNLYDHQTKQVNLRKRFIRAISHELKTPLMVINITAQGILDGIFSEAESEGELSKILGEITNLDVMIKDLLDVYKLDELNIKDDLIKINLRSVTQNSIDSVSNLTRRYNQTINLDCDRNSVIYGDPKFISMVVSNLITNAIKYTPNDENIDIEIVSVKDKITFRVTNYGVQIPKDALEHIWEPFYRVDESRTKDTKSKGTGLGLYIVSETLKAHGFSYGIKNIDRGVQAWFTATKNKK